MEKNALTWDEVLAAPGVERLQDAERHLDGWLVRYESPFFRAVVAAVELGLVHGHGGHGAPCYLYYTAEKAPDGTKQENWYPVWWKPGSYNLDEFDHPAVAGSDPSWWAAGINADGVFIPECSGSCPELGEYKDGEWVQTRSCQIGRGNCRGLALGHTTASGRLEWTVAQDSVTIQVYRPIPEGTFSPALRDEVRASPAAYGSAENIPPQFRTPWTAVAQAMRHVPCALLVAEVTIPLKAPYDFRVWVPHHKDGARPRHIDALMAAVATVVNVIGYEFPGGSPGDALGTLWDWFGAGYGPDGNYEFPVGVLLKQDPDWPRDPGALLGVPVYGAPGAPSFTAPPEVDE